MAGVVVAGRPATIPSGRAKLTAGFSDAPELRPSAYLTVVDALKLEIFQRAGSVVLAGASGLQRRIRWVHSAEITDIAQFLNGGELLLTAGTGIGESEAEQLAYVRSIAAADVAAVAIELSGRTFTAMPTAMVQEAGRLGMPLIAFGREIPFVEVAGQVHGKIVDLQLESLTRGQEASTAFTDLLLEGGDLVTVVGELARRLHHPCVLEDRAHQMRAYAGRDAIADSVVAEWGLHSRQRHGAVPRVDCVREVVAIRGEIWGWLHVLHPRAGFSEVDLFTIGRAAAAIAITLMGDQVRGARRAQRDGALISRLILGDISDDGFVERAMRLGQDFRNQQLIVAVASEVADAPTFGQPELSRVLAEIGSPAIVGDIYDRALAVIAVGGAGAEQQIVSALRDQTARVGLSRVVSVKQLTAGIRQATSAFTAATADDRLVRYDDLGLLRLLVALADDPELASYVEDELGKVIEHDVNSTNPLLPTLRAYLSCDGRKTQTAAELFIQRRTLYYRLDRLNSLLGVSLEDPAVRQRLWLAVRGLDLLNQRLSPPSAGPKQKPLS